MRVPELIAVTCVSLGFRVPGRRSSKVAAFGLDVAFARAEPTASVGTLDWRAPLTNVRVTSESTLRSATACPLCATNRTTTRKLHGNGSGQCAGRPPHAGVGKRRPRGRAGVDKQIQAVRKEREELEAREASYPLPAHTGRRRVQLNTAN
jgi:hypothetical protein